MVVDQDRVYTKNFVVEFGQVDHYTEFPMREVQRLDKDAWRHWPKEMQVEQSPLLAEQTFESDTRVGFENLSGETLRELKVNYSAILVYF